MKNYEEITADLFKRRDEYMKIKKKKAKILITSISLCLTILICVGVWQFDFLKTYFIEKSDETVVSSEENNSTNDSTQSEVVSEPDDPKSPIEQSVPSANDIPTEIGGGESWWFTWVYEYKYVESSHNYLTLMIGKEELNNWHQQFWTVNKETYTRVESVGIIGAVDEFGITKEQFVTAISENGVIIDGRYYYDNYPPGAFPPIDDSALERYWYLTQKEVDLIFSSDKELRDEKCRSRYTAFANGKIYTPHWICSHTAEDYIAAGLTKQQLIETISTWNRVGTPIVVEDDGEVWSDHKRFMTVIDFVKAEIDKMP